MKSSMSSVDGSVFAFESNSRNDVSTFSVFCSVSGGFLSLSCARFAFHFLLPSKPIPKSKARGPEAHLFSLGVPI